MLHLVMVLLTAGIVDCTLAPSSTQYKGSVLVLYIDKGLGFTVIDCLVHGQETVRKEMVLAFSPL